jgi:hypothetical protein
MTQKKYAIDACTLIDMVKTHPLGSESSSQVWGRVEDLLRSGYLFSSCEVYPEIKDEGLEQFLNPYKNRFLPLNEVLQKEMAVILEVFPEFVKARTTHSNSNTAPFLIATAIINECILVTNETRKHKKCNILSVCDYYNIPYINLNEFVEAILKAKPHKQQRKKELPGKDLPAESPALDSP